MKEKKVQTEIRYYEGFKFIYIVLPAEYRDKVKREQSVKISAKPNHEWRPRLSPSF